MSAAPHESQVLTTPFHSRTAPLNQTNEWLRWSGYTTVACFTHVEREYFAIRNTATLYDMSPMAKYRFTGPGAADYMNRLLTRDVTKLAPGRVTYAVWCNDAGKVLDDGTLFRFGEDEFRLCAQERHLPWLLDSAIGYDVQIEDVSERIAALALQGPTSCAVLKALGLTDIEMLRPFHMAELTLDGAALTVSRTGFTGDLGYELWVEPAGAEALWDSVMEAGHLHGIQPIGSAALDLARIEAGFIQAGADFVAGESPLRPGRLRSPFELSLDWLVDFEKAHFIGRRALLAERAAGPRRRLVGLDIEGNKPATDALVYVGKSRAVGAVTSAMWSPTCKRNIALATIDAPHCVAGGGLWAEIYIQRELEWRKVVAACRITPRPFFNPARRWASPAPLA